MIKLNIINLKRRKDGDYEQQIWRFNQCSKSIWIITAVAGIAFAVYKYLTPDYLEDFDPDDYSDDFDDDYIEFSDGEPEAED